MPIKEAILFSIASKKINDQGINLSKEVKGHTPKTTKTLPKEINEDLNKREGTPCSWAAKLNIVKVAVLPVTNYKFNTVPITITMTSFCGHGKAHLQIQMESQRPRIAKTIL